MGIRDYDSLNCSNYIKSYAALIQILSKESDGKFLYLVSSHVRISKSL